MLLLIRRWLRCWWYTGGTHQLQFDTNRCRYCRQPWSQLYPTKVPATPIAASSIARRRQSEERADEHVHRHDR